MTGHNNIISTRFAPGHHRHQSGAKSQRKTTDPVSCSIDFWLTATVRTAFSRRICVCTSRRITLPTVPLVGAYTSSCPSFSSLALMISQINTLLSFFSCSFLISKPSSHQLPSLPDVAPNQALPKMIYIRDRYQFLDFLSVIVFSCRVHPSPSPIGEIFG